MTDEPAALRVADLTALREEALKIVDDLISTYQLSDPAKGSESAVEKDLLSIEALWTLKRLTSLLAGWAISHQIGLALENLKFVYPIPAETRKLKAYAERLQKVDVHRHEIAGAALTKDDFEKLDPQVVRLALLNLAVANAGASPDGLQDLLRHALEGLEFGDVAPVLAPKPARKFGYDELRHQLKALAFIEYRRGLGVKKHSAVRQVSLAYDVSAETIAGWELRLIKDLGLLLVRSTLHLAKRDGRADDQSRANGEEMHGDREYGDKALRQAGASYKEAKRARAERRLERRSLRT